MNKLDRPREGFPGIWDSIVGPNMPATEMWLFVIPTLIATVAVPLYAVLNELGWNLVQLTIAAILAFDLVGGAIVNSTQTTKRWHHKPEYRFKHHFLFVAIHLHPLIVAWLYPGGNWTYSLFAYSYLIFATALILLSPPYLQRAVSIILYMGSLLLSSYLLSPIPGMEWFLPVYFLKLLISYLPQDIPTTLTYQTHQDDRREALTNQL
ncbi:MAG: hypothetical protein SW833_09925 [Cyanobacteriota bacterium]|nr:hypothetical protein [Cyanobacteriota bacterium]